MRRANRFTFVALGALLTIGAIAAIVLLNQPPPDEFQADRDATEAAHSAEPRSELTLEARAALARVKTATLYSLDPRYEETPAPNVSRLHGYEVLGSVELSGADLATAIGAFCEATNVHPEIEPYHCFDPRHALKFVDQGITYEILVCFACRDFVLYIDGKNFNQGPIKPAGGTPKLLNELFKQHKVPIAPNSLVR